MKATGKLIGKLSKTDLSRQPLKWYPIKGDKVIIELSRGLKVIGRCRDCIEYVPDTESDAYLHSGCGIQGWTGESFGCWDWKARRK